MRYALFIAWEILKIFLFIRVDPRLSASHHVFYSRGGGPGSKGKAVQISTRGWE
jgi:hypothetical protein